MHCQHSPQKPYLQLLKTPSLPLSSPITFWAGNDFSLSNLVLRSGAPSLRPVIWPPPRCWASTSLFSNGFVTVYSSSQSVNYARLPSEYLSASQCGFRAGRGTADMIFAARQHERRSVGYGVQHRDHYMIFIDLIKAFDSVHQEGLWKIPKKIGCPP